MSAEGRWIAGLALGSAGALLFGVGGIPVVLVLGLTVIPLALGRDGLAFLSGLLGAFGIAWLALTAGEAWSADFVGDATPWFALGVAALAIGVALGVASMRLGQRPRRTIGA